MKNKKRRRSQSEGSGSGEEGGEENGSGSNENSSGSEEEDSKEELDQIHIIEETKPGKITEAEKKGKSKKRDHGEDLRSMNMDGFRRKLEEVRRQCSKDQLWEDNDFLPLNDTLFKDPAKIKEIKTDYKKLSWMRPHSINADAKFSVSEFSKCDMKSGNMSDGVFTGALAMLAIHPCVENLFVDVDNMDKGYVAFQFFKNGEWRYVIVDTLLPYSESSKLFLFSECNETNEFWVPLIEKAYAKLNGSYQNIQGMDVCEVLVDLTGGVSERIDFENERTKQVLQTEAFYNSIRSHLNNHYILGCIKHVAGKVGSRSSSPPR